MHAQLRAAVCRQYGRCLNTRDSALPTYNTLCTASWARKHPHTHTHTQRQRERERERETRVQHTLKCGVQRTHMTQHSQNSMRATYGMHKLLTLKQPRVTWPGMLV